MTKAQRKKTYKLLVKTKEAIATAPKYFAMQGWWSNVEDEGWHYSDRTHRVDAVQVVDQLKGNDCGTACCIGGWMATIATAQQRTKSKVIDPETVSLYALFRDHKIVMPDVDQRFNNVKSDLFYVSRWHNFISDQTAVDLTTDINAALGTNYTISDICHIEMDEFDKLHYLTRQRIACSVIDDYIDKYFGDLK